MNLVNTFLIIISYTTLAYTQNLKSGDNCIIERSQIQGICKSLIECPSARNSQGIDYPQCGHEYGVMLACCPVESSATPVTPRRRQRISEIKCSEYESAVWYKANFTHISLIIGAESENILLSGCGNTEAPLIIGGEEAKPREFPHMALIAVNNGSNQQPEWICGGSLISDQFILTAAHCLLRNPNMVRLGELDYERTDDEASPQDYSIMESIPHKDYRYPSKHHDIALLKLNRIVEFNIFRRPACLPSFSRITEKVAIATGWGNTVVYEHSSRSSMLLKVALSLFDQSECIDIYSGQGLPIIDKQFCAGSKTDNRDTCQGDSGSPLQVTHEYENCMYRIIGITSYGVACGVGVPATYTKVFSYLNWIEQNVWGTSPDNIIFEDE